VPQNRSGSAREALTLQTDVLVIGGGPAATWAAATAAGEGATVVLADKGYCGTSGVAASAGVGHWLVPPDAPQREAAMATRARIGGYLTDARWQTRVLEQTWSSLGILREQGYPASLDARGNRVLRIGQAPEYMRFMRGHVRRRGVTILDHSPALELLCDSEGVVVGARGVQRQKQRDWEVRANAVVLATGGCTWKSHSLGGDVNTGDGQLMAAEVGAFLSGMEFSGFYGIVPKHTSMDKNGYYAFATFTREDGSEIDGNLFGSRAPLLGAALEGEVYAQLDKAPLAQRPVMRAAMPNFFMVLDKLGVDPFTQRFSIDFVLEGTVRGTGGLKLADESCWTGVPGLYAAGDTASREVLVGGATGAGAPNAAWAVSSGCWAGSSAARFARREGRRDGVAEAAGGLGLRSERGTPAGADVWRDLTRAVQAEILPIDKHVFRDAGSLTRGSSTLDQLYDETRSFLSAEGQERLRARETAAMLTMARWAYAGAAARTESRAMHTRTDFPTLDSAQQHRILVGGLRHVWTRVDPVAPVLVTREVA
jgi:succinate dehydrogenase/fumarate reductase flavoprotein subunit